MWEDGLVCFRRRVWVPSDNSLKLKIARQCHDSKVAGYFGRDKTLELVKRIYYWLNLEAWIRNYVKTCDNCQRNKVPRYAKYWNILPLEIPYAPWLRISIDFITGLPNVKGYFKIWVVVDYFTKMAHIIPLKTQSAKELANSFVNQI